MVDNTKQCGSIAIALLVIIMGATAFIGAIILAPALFVREDVTTEDAMVQPSVPLQVTTTEQEPITGPLEPNDVEKPTTPDLPQKEIGDSTGDVKQQPAEEKQAFIPPPKISPITPTEESPPIQQKPIPVDTSALNAQVRSSVVNLLCTGSGGSFKPGSGSGVIIDPRGIILTNAHIGQYFLLAEHYSGLTCTVRTGSPARQLYTARVLYMSEQWIAENKDSLNEVEPRGSGENDYALLVIDGYTKEANTASLPSFPFLTYNSDASDTKNVVVAGDWVLAAGYPAGFLGGIAIQKDLYMSSAFLTVHAIYTFEQSGGPLDLFSLGGSVVAQQGASGGAVVLVKNGMLIGIVTTTTLSDMTGDRDLRAISLAHITRSLMHETDLSLSDFLSSNTQTLTTLFADRMRDSAKILFDSI